jgi:hypothetical protein
MRTIFIVFLAIISITSCKKEDDSFLPKYEAIHGTWNSQSISFDSSGVIVTRSIAYDRLVINENLTYKIYYNSVNEIENGIIKIVSQSDSKLELFFEAHYPIYSSFAGSHIFTQSNVALVNLSIDELVLRDIDNSYYSPREYHFVK